MNLEEQTIYLHEKIQAYRAEAKDPEFVSYLNSQGRLLCDSTSIEEVEEIQAAVERNYKRYQERMREKEKIQKIESQTEYKVGAGVLGVVGIIFVLIAFFIFSTSYMNDFLLFGILTAFVVGIEAFIFVKKETKAGWMMTALHVFEAGIVVWMAVLCMPYISTWFVIPSLLVFLLLMILIRHTRVFYQCVGVFMIMATAYEWIGGPIFVSLCVGILLLSIFVFQEVKFLRAEHQKVYHYIALGCMACIYLTQYGWEHYLVYTIMFLFGLSAIFLFFQEKYGISSKIKGMSVAIFLTYMILSGKIPFPIVTSLILVVIAIVGVAFGFYLKQKSLRVYSLCLSLFVCAKLFLFDFAHYGKTQLMAAFFGVGITILGISILYLSLGKSVQPKDREDEEIKEELPKEEQVTEEINVEKEHSNEE